MSDLYVIRYRRGSTERVRRTAEGRKRRFTLEEARAWLRRNHAHYPNARLVRLRRGV